MDRSVRDTRRPGSAPARMGAVATLAQVRTARFLLMLSGIEMVAGLGIYILPGVFGGVTRHPGTLLPMLSPALTAGALALMAMVRQRPSAPRRRWLGVVAAMPLVALEVAWIRSGGSSPGAALVGILIAALLAAPWLPDESRPAAAATDQPILLAVVMGVVEGVAGAMLLALPGVRAFSWLRASLRGFLPLVGLWGLVGSAALLLPERGRAWGAPRGALRVLAATLFLAVLAIGAALRGRWTAVVILGVSAIALGSLAVPPGPASSRLAAAALREPGDGVERTLERWTWIIALLVQSLAAVAGAELLGPLVRVDAFIVVASATNIVLHWWLRAWSRPERRVIWHMCLISAAMGLLLTPSGRIGLAFIAFLAIAPAMAVHVGGGRSAQLVLAVGTVAAALGEAEDAIAAHLPVVGVLLRMGVVALVVVAAGLSGIGSALERGRLAAVLESTTDFVTIADGRRRMVFVNRAARRLLGLGEGADLGGVGWVRPGSSGGAARDEAVETAMRDGVWQGETALWSADGREIVCSQLVLAHRQPGGGLDFLATISRDIGERKRLEEQLLYLAEHDALTGLGNRRRFERQLALALDAPGDAGRGVPVAALLFVDIDQFKYVNDSLGHRFGDALLRGVSTVLAGCVGQRGAIGRLGGDEFAVLLPGAGLDEAEALAGRILDRLRAEHFAAEGHSVNITASIGIAVCPDHARTADRLLALADAALYEAKDAGRDTHRVYSPDAAGAATDGAKLAWEQTIRRALENDGLRLYRQPIVDVRSGAVRAYELLLRLEREDGTVVGPGAFLDVAERFGLIQAIDRWVVTQAIRLLATGAAAGEKVRLHVNLSGKCFGDPELLSLIRSELAASGADPHELVLEITETAVIADMVAAQRFITALRESGVRFAVDDFGVGFTSFHHLKHLPVDELKIHGSFIEGLARSPADQTLVRAMVSVAHGLGKSTVAEWVGDAQTLALVRGYGIDCAQGYHLGLPEPVPRPIRRGSAAS